MPPTLMTGVPPHFRSSPSAVESALEGILRAASACEELLGRVLKREGLSRPQFNVLRVLGDAAEHGLPCLEIGARMVTRVPDVTRLVDRLVAQGFVMRERSVTDRRVVRIRLKSKGYLLLDRVRPMVDDTLVRTLGQLGEDRLAELTALLDGLRSAVEASPDR
jgi:DNA-binding MarR family transcriptional regulator